MRSKAMDLAIGRLSAALSPHSCQRFAFGSLVKRTVLRVELKACGPRRICEPVDSPQHTSLSISNRCSFRFRSRIAQGSSTQCLQIEGAPNGVIPVSQVEACSASFRTLSSHAAPPQLFLAYDKGPPIRNAPAPLVNFAFQSKEV